MGCNGIVFKELRNEPAHVKLVFMMASELANCRNAVWKGKSIRRGEFITSLNHLAEHTSLSIKLVRSALARLKALEIIKTSTQDRKFTRISLSHAGTDSGTDSGTTIKSIKRAESKNMGTDSGTDSGNSFGVDFNAVRRSPDVDVSPALSLALQEPHTPPSGALATPKVNPPETPREAGLNPRSLATNPRALGTNPRAIEKQAQEARAKVRSWEAPAGWSWDANFANEIKAAQEARHGGIRILVKA